MILCYKYNIQVKDVPGTGKTWMIHTHANNGNYEELIYTDHIEFRGVPLWTTEKNDGFNFGIMAQGDIKRKIHPGTGRPYILVVPEEGKDYKSTINKQLRGVKYHVPSQGKMQDNTWRIYMNIEKGVTETEYVDHVEFLNVPSFTGEAAYRIGFSQLSEGDVTFDYDPNTGKRYAIIHDGSYKPQYNEKLEKL